MIQVILKVGCFVVGETEINYNEVATLEKSGITVIRKGV